MLDTVRYESERLLPGSLVVSLALAAFAAMAVAIGPDVIAELDVETLVEGLPPAFVEVFRLEALATMEGYVALEVYQFVWVLGLGAYVAYVAAGTVAGDLDTGRMDTLLAAPVSRGRVVAEKFLGTLVPIAVANVVVYATVYAGTLVVAEPLSVVDLAAVHALSVPYLLCCAAFGTLASVAAPSRLVAEGVAAGGVVGAFLVDAVVTGTDVEWLGAVAPMRYYDPLDVLTASEYDLGGAAVLLGATLALLWASARVFGEVDLR